MTGIGETLRGARERRGDDLATCASATRISLGALWALEQERLEALPPETDAPDLVLRYATHLGLDADRLADEVRAERSDEPDADTQPLPVVAGRASRDSGPLWVVAGAILGLGALVALAGGLGQDSPTAANPPSSQPTPRPPSPTASPAPPPPQTLRPTAPTRPAIDVRLAARHGKTVWVEVRREGASGQSLFAGIVGNGVTRRFASAKPLWLGVAWAPNVTVTINGEVTDAEGGTESYLVTPNGLKRFTSSS